MESKNDLPVWAYLLIFLAIIFFIALKTSGSDEAVGTLITEDGTRAIYATDFEIIEEETTGTRSEDGTYTITGKLKQNIEGSYTGIFVTITLLDENGDKVRDTTGLQYTNYLGNNIWEFEVYGNDADNVVTSYGLKYCTTY